MQLFTTAHRVHLNDYSVGMVESLSYVLMALNTETSETLPLQHFSHVSDCSVQCANGTIITK